MARFKPLDPGSAAGVSQPEREMGVRYTESDGGDITSREAGLMVKRMIEFAEKNLKSKGPI